MAASNALLMIVIAAAFVIAVLVSALALADPETVQAVRLLIVAVIFIWKLL